MYYQGFAVSTVQTNAVRQVIGDLPVCVSVCEWLYVYMCGDPTWVSWDGVQPPHDPY